MHNAWRMAVGIARARFRRIIYVWIGSNFLSFYSLCSKHVSLSSSIFKCDGLLCFPHRPCLSQHRPSAFNKKREENQERSQVCVNEKNYKFLFRWVRATAVVIDSQKIKCTRSAHTNDKLSAILFACLHLTLRFFFSFYFVHRQSAEFI